MPLRLCLKNSPLIMLASLLIGVPGARATAADAAPRPNVLFISIDDMNNRLGCYGFDAVPTPNLDRLAARGVKFERAYCNYPVCNVSRTSFLSGRRPETKFQPDEVTWLPEHFAANGYFTAEVGKVAHSYGVTRETIQWDLSEYDAKWPGRETEEEKHVDGRRTMRAIQLMEERREKPFFLAVGFQKPHSPFKATPKYHAMYPAEKIALLEEPAEHLKEIPSVAFLNSTTEAQRNRTPDERRELTADYYACHAFIDAQVGLLLDAVDRLGIADRTIIVFFSDHGLHLGEHGGMWGKRSLFEESMRIPLIVAAPGKRQGTRSPRLVELVDLYPTLADLCGLPAPPQHEGTSFAALLAEPERSWKAGAFGNVTRPDGQSGRTVRTERYRYIEWGGPETAQLYDLEQDPHEHRNLVGRSERAETLAMMRQLLEDGWSAAAPKQRASRN
ncbi:MAG: sulfatase [Planctomycetaceae bacterium]